MSFTDIQRQNVAAYGPAGEHEHVWAKKTKRGGGTDESQQG